MTEFRELAVKEGLAALGKRFGICELSVVGNVSLGFKFPTPLLTEKIYCTSLRVERMVGFK